jgi:DNA replication and repair protein RecF
MFTDIHLQNYRSYKEGSFDFDNNVNIIIGQNGSGKTNLLESIMMISRGISYRAKDHHLVTKGKTWSKIEAHTIDQIRTLKLEQIEDDKVSKNFIINTQNTKRLNIDQTVPIVLFEPNHLQLLSGVPEARRSYLDDILVQTKPGYKRTLLQYKRILAQRNNLLKSGNVNKLSIFAWNIQLSEAGGQIFRARNDLIDIINQQITDFYRSISTNKEQIKLEHISEFNPDQYESELLSKLENFSHDLLRGHTMHGPHRDDIKILIDNHEINSVASRGETRTTLLSLKLIEAKIIEQFRDKKPVLLLDDVFGELDQQRRKLLTNRIKDYQSFITTTDADVVIKHFDKTANIIITQAVV